MMMDVIAVKKFFCFLLACMLVVSLGACAKNDVKEEESTEPEQEIEIFSLYEAASGEQVTNKLYAVFNADDIKTNDFSFVSGSVSPERIAAGFTGWTGLSFRITAETDSAAKTMKIDFKPESSFVTGEIPEDLRDDFAFTDAKEMRIFMMNSLCKTIRENMGGYDVYFTADGSDIATLDIDSALNSDTAFNKTQSDVVLVR